MFATHLYVPGKSDSRFLKKRQREALVAGTAMPIPLTCIGYQIANSSLREEATACKSKLLILYLIRIGCQYLKASLRLFVQTQAVSAQPLKDEIKSSIAWCSIWLPARPCFTLPPARRDDQPTHNPPFVLGIKSPILRFELDINISMLRCGCPCKPTLPQHMAKIHSGRWPGVGQQILIFPVPPSRSPHSYGASERRLFPSIHPAKCNQEPEGQHIGAVRGR